MTGDRSTLAWLALILLAGAACRRPVPVERPIAAASDSAAAADSSGDDARVDDDDRDARRGIRSGSRADAAEWRGQTVSRVEELFVGRFPGVRVYGTPQGMAVRVRGNGSALGGGEPLYVIDGFPIEAGPGGLVALNPADVASIEVLKDASSLSYYGVRGANGVVLITTRRGP